MTGTRPPGGRWEEFDREARRGRGFPRGVTAGTSGRDARADHEAARGGVPDRGPRADREAAGGGTLGGSLWADPEAAGGAPGRGPRPRPDGMPSVLGPQQAPEHWHDDRRRPVQLRTRRTAGDVLAGLGALLALVGLVGGVPYALLRLAGPPITGDLLNADLFTSQVGPETITAILILLVWLAWLQLFLCVVVEVYAALRRVGMPARVPLSGGTQALANRLVSAVLLLFTATAVAVPIARAGAPPRSGPTSRRCRRRCRRPRRSDRPCTPGRSRRSTWSSRRTGATTRACGRSRRSAWETGAAIRRSTGSTSTRSSPTAAGCTWPTSSVPAGCSTCRTTPGTSTSCRWTTTGRRS